VYAASRPPPSPSPQLPYTRPYSSVDVVPFGAPFMDRGKVPQCPETGTKFIFLCADYRHNPRCAQRTVNVDWRF
jgi:hypothetical protein